MHIIRSFDTIRFIMSASVVCMFWHRFVEQIYRLLWVENQVHTAR